MLEVMTDRLCASCGDKVVVARGLCHPCWYRHSRDGTLDQFPKKRNGVITRPGRNGNRYRYINMPDHPVAAADGFVAEHRMIAWDLGWLMNLSDIVHHKDGNGLNNDPDNLEVMDAGEHRHSHAVTDGTTNQFGHHPARPETCDLCHRTTATGRYCVVHYSRWVRTGDPLGVRRVDRNTVKPYRFIPSK